jgi:hypothetical protein
MNPEVNNGNSFRRTKEKKEKTKKNLTLFVRFDIILVESEGRSCEPPRFSRHDRCRNSGRSMSFNVVRKDTEWYPSVG